MTVTLPHSPSGGAEESTAVAFPWRSRKATPAGPCTKAITSTILATMRRRHRRRFTEFAEPIPPERVCRRCTLLVGMCGDAWGRGRGTSRGSRQFINETAKSNYLGDAIAISATLDGRSNFREGSRGKMKLLAQQHSGNDSMVDFHRARGGARAMEDLDQGGATAGTGVVFRTDTFHGIRPGRSAKARRFRNMDLRGFAMASTAFHWRSPQDVWCRFEYGLDKHNGSDLEALSPIGHGEEDDRDRNGFGDITSDESPPPSSDRSDRSTHGFHKP